MGHKEHRSKAPLTVTIAVLTVSTSRTLAQDASGQWIAKRAAREGLRVVARHVVTDDMDAIRQAIASIVGDTAPHAVIVTGGTGISPRDVTIEALRPLMTKELTAFGPIFAQLSFEEIDSAALMSRATAGLIGGVLIFCLPGSLKACQLACKALIFPELGHLTMHVQDDATAKKL